MNIKQMNGQRCTVGKLYYTYLFMHLHVETVGHFVILNVKKTRIKDKQ